MAQDVLSIPTSPLPPRPTARTPALLRAVRPGEWIKNGFVLTPLLFGGHADRLSDVARALVTVLAFSAVAGAGYLVNDVHDAALDRQHPTKRYRPIAAGELSARSALVAAALLAACALAMGSVVNLEVGAVIAAYGALTVAYSFALKTLVIVDVMTIAACFLLRVLAGSVAVDARASRWLIICTGMVALFLGFTKRRQEAVLELQTGERSRPVLEHYSLPFLDQMVSLVTAGTVLAYALYASQSPVAGDRMLWSVPAVIYGIFRYLYLIYDRADTRDTGTLIRRDPGMRAAAVAWLLSVLAILYF